MLRSIGNVENHLMTKKSSHHFYVEKSTIESVKMRWKKDTALSGVTN